jgi:hypothetical protein
VTRRAVFAARFPAPWRDPRPEFPPLFATLRDPSGLAWRVVERRDEYATLKSGALTRMISRETYAEWLRGCATSAG